MPLTPRSTPTKVHAGRQVELQLEPEDREGEGLLVEILESARPDVTGLGLLVDCAGVREQRGAEPD
jgi:hypothetical protein